MKEIKEHKTVSEILEYVVWGVCLPSVVIIGCILIVVVSIIILSSLLSGEFKCN